jgi:hypothetical protein
LADNLRWVFGNLVTRGRDVTAEDVAQRYARLLNGWDWREIRDIFQYLAGRMGDFSLSRVLSASDDRISVELADGKSRKWELNVESDTDFPDKIGEFQVVRSLKPGMAVRCATFADNEELADVSRRTPISIGDESLTIDYGSDYFAGIRLMGEATVVAATYEGRIVGVHVGALTPVCMAGDTCDALILARTRILPEHDGSGLGSRLNDLLFYELPYPQKWTVAAAYLSPGNSTARSMMRGFFTWPVQPLRLILDCEMLAGASPDGRIRRATRDDGAQIAQLLNSCHSGEEMYLPYTRDSLEARLRRDPGVYGWQDILVTDSAAVGVRESGEIRTSYRNGSPHTSRRASVLDYGFAPGAEPEFEALLRAWCRDLCARGVSHLGVFTSPRSPGADVLRSLAVSTEPYDFCVTAPEPAHDSDWGLYTDAIYF